MSTAAKPPSGVVIGLIGAASLLLAACGSQVDVSADNGNASASAGPLVVAKDLLSAEVQAQLTKKLGHPSPPVNCPDDLDPSVGTTTTCTMNDPKGTYNVTVTVTKVDWSGFGNFGVGNAIFDAKVADQPNP